MMDIEALNRLAGNIEQHAFRRGYVSAFTLAAFPVPAKTEISVHVTRECDGLVYGNAEVGTLAAFKACVDALDGRVDYIVYDIDLPFEVVRKDGSFVHAPTKSVLLPYRDLDVWISSVKYTLLALVPDLAHKKCVLVTRKNAPNTLGSMIYEGLQGVFGFFASEEVDDDRRSVKGTSDVAFDGADIIIGGAVYNPVITTEHILKTGKKPLLVDAGIGTLTLEASDYARKNGLKIIRVDNRAAMAGTLMSIIQSYDLVTRVMGEGEIDGVPVVAGGIVGAPGTVIVDSIHQPSEIIGIADGTGKVRYEPENDEERKRLERVNRIISGNSDG